MQKKILIVDDDREILEIVERILELKGYTIFTALNGEEALRKVEGASPDLIILDLVLPLVSGEQVCRKIKRNPKTKDIPIIMLTGKDSEADEIIGRVLGADYYLTKPLGVEKLLQAIEDCFKVREF
ncbi:MAG: response regulator [Candidatus Omnitrophica bacterium]|nr:response regulator [Candidatus Omnitrophota bacterium]MBU1869538.1 response regulator [Candidatus Omnitrophota bacterium]